MEPWRPATHYATLGVGRDATDDQLKKQYKLLAKHHHPDRNRGDEAAAAERFKAVHEAYATLSDKEARREYDAELSRQQFRSQKLVEVLQIAIERREYLLSLQSFRSPRDAASSADAVERVTTLTGISDDVAPLTARGHLRGAAHLPPPPPDGRAGSIFGEAASDYSYSAHEEYYSEYSYAADATPEEAAPADAAPADADYYDIEYDYSEYSDDGATANMTELLHVDEYAAPAPEPSLSRVPVSGTLAGLHVNE